ncbi:hypothetical protein CRG98_020339 [Punica granatum]|uniref:Uncharacterized protein n=1 Tax=Punica granatum TaxID=22663 RepID=A0A2I0JSG1_PUNGR|nr:hypothetical protein CRG98_020339 [Punica granatum]
MPRSVQTSDHLQGVETYPKSNKKGRVEDNATKGAEAGYPKTRSRSLWKEEVWSDGKGAELRQKGSHGVALAIRGQAESYQRSCQTTSDIPRHQRGGWDCHHSHPHIRLERMRADH